MANELGENTWRFVEVWLVIFKLIVITAKDTSQINTKPNKLTISIFKYQNSAHGYIKVDWITGAQGKAKGLIRFQDVIISDEDGCTVTGAYLCPSSEIQRYS